MSDPIIGEIPRLLASDRFVAPLGFSSSSSIGESTLQATRTMMDGLKLLICDGNRYSDGSRFSKLVFPWEGRVIKLREPRLMGALGWKEWHIPIAVPAFMVGAEGHEIIPPTWRYGLLLCEVETIDANRFLRIQVCFSCLHPALLQFYDKELLPYFVERLQLSPISAWGIPSAMPANDIAERVEALGMIGIPAPKGKGGAPPLEANQWLFEQWQKSPRRSYGQLEAEYVKRRAEEGRPLVKDQDVQAVMRAAVRYWLPKKT